MTSETRESRGTVMSVMAAQWHLVTICVLHIVVYFCPLSRCQWLRPALHCYHFGSYLVLGLIIIVISLQNWSVSVAGRTGWSVSVADRTGWSVSVADGTDDVAPCSARHIWPLVDIRHVRISVPRVTRANSRVSPWNRVLLEKLVVAQMGEWRPFS